MKFQIFNFGVHLVSKLWQKRRKKERKTSVNNVPTHVFQSISQTIRRPGILLVLYNDALYLSMCVCVYIYACVHHYLFNLVFEKNFIHCTTFVLQSHLVAITSSLWYICILASSRDTHGVRTSLLIFFAYV